MEDRRLSKRKTKRPSYLDNFHTEDSKEQKPPDRGSKGTDLKRSSIKTQKMVKIKPKSSVKENRKQGDKKKIIRKVNSVRKTSPGKPIMFVRSSLVNCET